MLEPEDRLHEARIQIRIAADDLDDEQTSVHLKRAEALVEGVRRDILDGDR